MANLDVPKIVRRVRQRMGLSQEGLSRRLNTTKGAVQHWERGRNEPDMARLFALRHICPNGPERNEIDSLIRQAQAKVVPQAVSAEDLEASTGNVPVAKNSMLARENERLRKQLAKVEAQLQRRTEQVRILEGLAADLQREMASLRALSPGSKPGVAPSNAGGN